MEHQLKNNNISVEFHTDENKAIVVRDLNDVWNETTAYTRNVRNVELAWKFIEQLFGNESLKDDLTFNDIISVLDEKFKLNTRIYCAVD